MDDVLEFRVYITGRDAALTEDGDGELRLRLRVPGDDGAAVRELLSLLRMGDGATARLVVVRE